MCGCNKTIIIKKKEKINDISFQVLYGEMCFKVSFQFHSKISRGPQVYLIHMAIDRPFYLSIKDISMATNYEMSEQ